MMFNRNYYNGESYFSGRFDFISPGHILILIGAIILIVSAFKILSERTHKSDSKIRLLRLLKERLVSGEITDVEYRSMKKVVDED